MATAYKVLGQSNPAANTATTLYTVPAATSTIVSTLSICNQAATGGTVKVAIRPAGATLTTQHYLAFDTPVPANDMLSLTLGLTLATTDVVTVNASSALISFHAYGSEIT